MNKRIAIVLAIAMATIAAQAAQIKTVASGLWSAPATWDLGVPGTNTLAADSARMQSGFTVTVDSVVPYTLTDIQVGRASVGNLIVNSGANLNLTGGTLSIGNAKLSSGTFTMNGGTIIGKDFSVGTPNDQTAGSLAIIHGGTNNFTGVITVGKAANASMTMDGGSVTAGVLALGDTNNLFNGSSYLLGGTMTCTSAIPLTINALSKLDIRNNATLVLNGNQLSSIDAFVTATNIV